MYYIGIDLGGTNIYAGVTDTDGVILSRAHRKTNLPRPSGEIVADIIGCARDAVANAGFALSDIAAVGVCSPGSVNLTTGVVEYSNNLEFTDVPLRGLLSDALGIPAHIANDANASAWGEYRAGAGKNTRDFVAVTLGTGVGAGVIISGRLMTGFNDGAGELGHTVIVAGGDDCTCGRRGCVEAYTSATALIRQTRAAMTVHRSSKLWEVARTLEDVDGKTAFDGALLGDAAAADVVAQYIEYLGIALTNIVNTFQPERLSIGGGVSAQGDVLLTPLREHVNRARYTRNSARNTEISVSQLGNDAGIIGAALLHELG
ncbi:MAG: ROK family protein [Oscillospiraceae bacterium]|jgi:glucokinase|nr:ROK family protein [Oscillospiraceae bacterium]